MRIFAVRSIWPGILLLLASAAQAASIEKGYHIEPQVLPQESTDKFLGKVRPSNNSRPASNTIKPADQPKSGGSSVAKSGSQNKKPIAADRITSTSLEKRPVAPAPVAPTLPP